MIDEMVDGNGYDGESDDVMMKMIMTVMARDGENGDNDSDYVMVMMMTVMLW